MARMGRPGLSDAYAQLPGDLGLGLLAQRRLTDRFKLEFPGQLPARCVFHRTPPQVSIALFEVSIKRGYLHSDPNQSSEAPDKPPFGDGEADTPAN